MSAYKKKKGKSPSFVMLEKRELLQSKAWKELSGSAVKVFIVLRTKTFAGLNDQRSREDIKMPYSIIEADTGLSRQTVRNALIALENMGFIDFVAQGGLKSGGYTMNTYRLSTRFYQYGTEQFVPGQMKKVKGFTDRGFGKYWEEQTPKAA